MAFKKYALAAAVMAVMSGSSMAQDLNSGHIQFNGLVNPNTCTVKMLADSVTQNEEDFRVALKTVDITDFASANNNDVASVLGETDFTMDVTCPGTVTPDAEKNISVQFNTFNGTTTDSTGLLFPQENIEGAASKVALVLKNADNTQVKMGQVNNDQKQPLDANGHASLSYKVAYTKTDTAVTNGTVTAYTTYTMSYQ
ncbi:TPA: fimbrial protein [Citrobacter freundii]|nr:fimbrial protein [Citrobacter freundii]